VNEDVVVVDDDGGTTVECFEGRRFGLVLKGRGAL